MTASRQPAILTLRAGDTVLIALNDDPPPDELVEIADALHQSFRGVDFVIVSNAAGVLVKPPELTTKGGA